MGDASLGLLAALLVVPRVRLSSGASKKFSLALSKTDSDMSTDRQSPMAMREQEPAMPVRPRPEDIALYNEWARRAGRPLWGQPAAKAKARPRVGVRRPVPQPATHGGVQGGADGGFIRGTYVRNATIYARRTDGAEVAIAHFMQRLNRWTVTEAGRDYYRHNRQQFIVNVPAIAYVYRASLGMYIRCTINHVPGGPHSGPWCQSRTRTSRRPRTTMGIPRTLGSSSSDKRKNTCEAVHRD